jgi:hypothetical protein
MDAETLIERALERIRRGESGPAYQFVTVDEAGRMTTDGPDGATRLILRWVPARTNDDDGDSWDARQQPV